MNLVFDTEEVCVDTRSILISNGKSDKSHEDDLNASGDCKC